MTPASTPPTPLEPTGRTIHDLDLRGQVRDWLVSPAWSHPCTDLGEVLDADGSPWGPDGRWTLTNGPDVAPLKSRLYARRPLVTEQSMPEVVEGAVVSWTAPFGGTDTGALARVHTGWDGLVDWSQFCFTPEYRHAVAATVLEVDQPEWRTLEVRCTGPVAVWVGGELSGVFTDFGYMEPVISQLRVRLPSGATSVVLSTWQVAFREVRHVVGLRVRGLPVRVVIPSPGADEPAASVAAQLLDSLAVDRWAVDHGEATIYGPPGTRLTVAVDRRPPTPVQLTDGRATVRIRPEAVDRDGDAIASMLTTGEASLVVGVDDPRCPITRTLNVASLPSRHRTRPQGDDPAVWRREVLEAVAGAHPSSARALARAELDPSRIIEPAELSGALAMIESRSDCADFEAVGIVHLLHRIPADRWPEGLRAHAVRSLLHFKYWIDQPGLDAMCYFTENHQMVWHTAELLIGELFAQERFANTGWLGSDHAAHGRELANAWIARKLAGGFSEFDSNAYLAIDTLALCSLVEFAADDDVRRRAECLLDKILLTLASNSWRGVHGAAHGRSYVQTLRSSRFEETAPIMWALWGVGAINNAVLPVTALTTARTYRVPGVVRAVGSEIPEEWEGRQVYRGRYRLAHDLLDRPYASDLRVWRTPDAMLASVQDYRAGLPGLQEHIWGATLGPEVQVFATHPAADSVSSSARPNAWAGQRVLPRARQHRGTVLVLHRIPEGDPVPRTHLWFPAPLMDETRRRGPWLAGRCADGYVAVATAGGLEPVLTGDEARQTWIPSGDGCAYVVTVGRRAVHGPFDDFVDALAEPEFGTDRELAPHVSWTDLDGHVLDLAWTGPFTVSGAAADLGDDGRPETPPHLANPAVTAEFGAGRLCAEWMGERLELDLLAGRRLDPETGVRPGPHGAQA